MKTVLLSLPLAVMGKSMFEQFEEYEQVNLPDEKLDPLTKPPKCYGIALSDATYNGPYQAGALIGLLKKQKPGQEYQVITGVTMGAINGYLMALHNKTDRSNIIHELSKRLLY